VSVAPVLSLRAEYLNLYRLLSAFLVNGPRCSLAYEEPAFTIVTPPLRVVQKCRIFARMSNTWCLPLLDDQILLVQTWEMTMLASVFETS
jgi:hypothetical protein